MAEAKVKICGITRPEDAVVAAEAGAWAIGLVFAPGSPRRLSLEQARRIAAVVPAGVLTVGVFANQALEELLLAEQSVRLDLLQLHGGESDLFCRTLGARRCVRAVSLDGPGSVESALAKEAEFVLVDRRRVSGSPQGPAVDWALAAELARRRDRTLLAGGLGPDNVEDAVRRVRPWGVDVSSGVERAPGVKDAAKVRAFVAAARGGAA